MPASWTAELFKTANRNEEVEPKEDAKKACPPQAAMMADHECGERAEHKAGDA